jgi:hypothetical protein
LSCEQNLYFCYTKFQRMKTWPFFFLNSKFLGQVLLYLLFVLSSLTFQLHAQFTSGRLVVLQAGDGSIPLSSNGNHMVFKEYSTSGTPGYSMSVPSTGTNALIIRGSALSEGHISLSEDASCIVFGGYAQSLPFANPLNTPAASTLNRGIGLVLANGTFSIGAIGASPIANGDIRGATATNSTNLWASSSSAGASYYGPANAQGNVQNSKANLRSIHVFNHQLFISSQSTAGTPSVLGIYSVGSGTPVTSAQNVSVVINTGSNSQPCQFYFNAANTICYVADSRNSGQGGVQKWVNNSNTWTLAYTLPTGTSAIGALGVVADFSGNNPKVYATTTEGNNNRLVAINDLGPTSTATTLATASLNNTVFRGLCFSPGTIPCNSPVIIGITNNSVQCSTDTLVLFPNVLGNTPLSYTWSGTGNFNSFSAPNPSITNSSSGIYSLSVSNVCGTSNAVVNININQSPTLQVNAPTICTGGSATLLVNGASTYTWSTGGNASSFTVSPLNTTVYTVTGTSSASCVSVPFITTVNVISSISLSSSSATICAGASATLQVSGASSYTWNTSSTGNLLIVSPLTNTNYTVVGSAPGCPNNASTTANVLVNPLPVINLVLPYAEVCETEFLFQISTNPPGGTLSGPGLIGTQFSPSLAGIGTHTITYTYTNVNSCTNSGSQTLSVMACTGLQNEERYVGLAVYPNPANEYLSILNLSGSLSISVRILNLTGQEIKVYLLNSVASLSVQDLEPGLYILEVRSDSKYQRLKFIRE